MWFPLALTAMLMLVARRSGEKTLSSKIPATAMAWLQQFFGLPFMALLLPFATFYNPFSLSRSFYWILLTFTILGAIDLILYFKALSMGDISVLSSVVSLVVVSMLAGSYVILGQVPSQIGIAGSACVILGAYFASKKPPSVDVLKSAANRTAILIMLVSVVLRGIYLPLEVVALRETNAFYFNFLTSAIMVPVLMLAAYLWGRWSHQTAFGNDLWTTIKKHRLWLTLIGLTYTVNLSCTFLAYLSTDNSAYVTAIKSAQVLPMVLLGVFFFKEKVQMRQWVGLAVILVGLGLFSQA